MDASSAGGAASLVGGAIERLFDQARTFSQFLDMPVADETLLDLARLMQFGPTSMNTLPGRVLFLKSPAARARLLPLMSEGNRAKTAAAPVTAIIAQDVAFHETMPITNPRATAARERFAGNPDAATATAARNGTMQAGYFIMAARALGLDAGPMGGFDASAVDAEFFAGTSWRSNLIINLGIGDRARLHPRGARLEATTVARII